VDIARDEEQRRLVREYFLASQHYAWAVGALEQERGSDEAFKDALKVVEQARRQCELTRIALAVFRKSARASLFRSPSNNPANQQS